MQSSGGKVVALRPGDAESVPLEQRRGPQPVSSLWQLFFAHSSFMAYRPNTRKNFERTAALCREQGMADFPGPGDVSIWLSRLRELPGRRGKKLSGTYVTLQRDNLHALFQWGLAMGFGWCNGNPADARLCPFSRVQPLRAALRAVDDVWPFLLACGGDGSTAWSVRVRGFLAVLRYLGLRKGEALALRASSVTVDAAGVWWVEVLDQRSADEWALLPPKTERARRKLVCRPELVSLLQAVLKLGSVTRVSVGLGGQGGEREVPFLFPFRTYDLNQVMAALRGAVPDDFPPGDAWHVFRHTVACELATRGASVEEVSEWLGHCDIAHTQTYLRTLVGTRVKASMLDYFADEKPTTKGGAPAGSKKPGKPRSNATPPAPHPRSFRQSPVK